MISRGIKGLSGGFRMFMESPVALQVVAEDFKGIPEGLRGFHGSFWRSGCIFN